MFIGSSSYRLNKNIENGVKVKVNIDLYSASS